MVWNALVRNVLFLIIFLILVQISIGQPLLDPWYANNARIYEILNGLQQRYPTRIRVDSVGHSQADSLPIWMAKISNNVTPYPTNKPKVLIIGQVHAEEVLGMMLTLQLATDLCSLNINTSPRRYQDWRNYLEIYLIPSANPEGLQVVTDQLDLSYRKNKRDNIGDGIFRYVPIDSIYGPGYDTSGVDINRNFPLNWDRGDRFLDSSESRFEPYDYYRGQYPFSEPETQVLRDLALSLRPTFSIIYHSSRRGGLAGKIYFPWDWLATENYQGKRSPDYNVIYQIGLEMGNVMESRPSGFYLPSGSRQMAGAAHDWFYWSYGGIQYLIEIGPVGVPNAHQPTRSIAEAIINEVIDGTYVLFNRLVPINPTGSCITGTVYNALNNQPIPDAEIRILPNHSRLLQPRLTDQFGTFLRPLLAGSYTLIARKFGYQPRVFSNLILGNAQRRVQNIQLTPLPYYNLQIHVVDNQNNPVAAFVYLSHPDKRTDTLSTDNNGNVFCYLPADTFDVVVYSENYVVKRFPIVLTHDWQYQEVRLLLSENTWFDGFENGLQNWTASGNVPWGLIDEGYTGTYALADSPVRWELPILPEEQYAANSNGNLLLNPILNFSLATDVSLSYMIRGALEPEYDSTWVEISTDGNQWTVLPQTIRMANRFNWERVHVNLSPWIGIANVRLRWRLTSDDLVNEDGIYLDDIVIKASSSNTLKEREFIPTTYELGKGYPNPFNHSIRFQYSVPHLTDVQFNIYDALGRVVHSTIELNRAAGKYEFYWSVKDIQLSSSIYFIEMKTKHFQSVQKILLLK
ncbi:MAG: M14 family zinc carboxypeptidase [bacterium]|nr:M14 family zinc carboxypeptidase [bacterium]